MIMIKWSYKNAFLTHFENKTTLKMHLIYFLTANKTCCLEDFLFFLLLTPQVSKCIDDDTKDEVEDNNYDHEEEQQVVDHPGCEKGLLLTPNRRKLYCYNKQYQLVSQCECHCHGGNRNSMYSIIKIELCYSQILQGLQVCVLQWSQMSDWTTYSIFFSSMCICRYDSKAAS